MRKILAIIATASVLSLTAACSSVSKRAPSDFGGTEVEEMKTLNRPAEMGAEVTTQVIEGESSSVKALFGLISWGTDVQFSTPLIKTLVPFAPFGADPVNNAVGDAVTKANVDGMYVTHVHQERFRLLDFGVVTDTTDALPIFLYPIKYAIGLTFSFFNGIYERQTTKVTGRAIKLKALGIVSADRFDAYKAIDSSICKFDCKGNGLRNNGPYR